MAIDFSEWTSQVLIKPACCQNSPKRVVAVLSINPAVATWILGVVVLVVERCRPMLGQRIRVPNLGATVAALSASFSTPPRALAMPLIDGAGAAFDPIGLVVRT